MINTIVDRTKRICIENPVEITAVAVCAIAHVLYVSLFYSVEVLFLSSFMGDVQFVGAYFDDTLALKDMLRRFGEHGLLGYDVLLLVNASLFEYTSRFDLVVNCINVIACGSFVVYCMHKSITDKNISYYLGVVLVSIVMFSTMQGSSATMETQVRLGLMFFLFGAYFVGDVITKHTTSRTLCAAIALILIGTNIFGTLYNFAGLPVAFALMLIFSVRDRHIDRNYYVLAATYLISTVLYLVMYDLCCFKTAGDGSVFNGMMFWILHPLELLKAVCAYNGSAVLGYRIMVDSLIPHWAYLTVGVLVTGIYAYSIVLFIKTKMYEHTVLPVLLHGYSFFVVILALVGRYQYADWTWGTCNWYHVHTKLGLASSLWIIAYALSKEMRLQFSLKPVVALKAALGLASFSLIACALFIGIAVDVKCGPHVRSWYQNKADYMFVDAADMPVDKDGKTPLLVDKATTVMCLDILKKYKLSVFSDSATAAEGSQ